MTLIDLNAAIEAHLIRDDIVKTNTQWNPLSEYGQTPESQQSVMPPLESCYDPTLQAKLETELAMISTMIDRYEQRDAGFRSARKAQAARATDSAVPAFATSQDVTKDTKFSSPKSTADRNTTDTPTAENLPARRVNIVDPCFKVLPRALRQQAIKAPWTYYDLHIIHDDGQQCCGLWEKPLIVFKKLDKGGKNPRFDLRERDVPHSWPAAEAAVKS